MIKQATDYIKMKINGAIPKIGIVLGSGLGSLAQLIQSPITIPYEDIPGFVKSTADGHKGNLIIGILSGKKVIIMQGRFHYYEGYSMQQITFPIRVMKVLGVEFLLVTNASGSLNQNYSLGDLVVLSNHINMMPNPLIGPNMDDFGPRFLDITLPYNRTLIQKAYYAAEQMQINLKQGVYIAVTGPSYETQAEYSFYQKTGADVIGMSTVGEVIVAKHCSMDVLGLSVVTSNSHDNPDSFSVDSGEVLQAADEAAAKVNVLFSELVKLI
ncbi:MAG: purine-nucleoside phosphorylase [Bacteroidales bacterium]|nr:purine-nucleoside phosphorylase [Bacteroidales bacterium]